MKKDLTSIFGKFVGREIEVREVFDEATGKTIFAEPLSSPEPVIEEMKRAAKDNGLSLRAIFPGTSIAKDRNMSRVNARFEKDSGGAWRVNNFQLG